MADIEAVTRDALREVRQAVSGYHRPALDAELEGARTALERRGHRAAIDRPQVALPPDVEAVLAWTVREGATNVIRHSGAATAPIRVVPALGEATVEVVDDGRGGASATARAMGSTGLASARARRRRAPGGGPARGRPGFRLRARAVPVESAR